MGPAAAANVQQYKIFLPQRPGDGDLRISLLFLDAISKREREGEKSAMRGNVAITVLKNRFLPIPQIIQATKTFDVARS